MTHESASSADAPHDLLAAVRDATRRVRAAQRGTWFPLLVFGGITLASIPIYRFTVHHKPLGTCRFISDHQSVCAGTNPAAYAYWLVALVAAYAVIARFYVRQSRRRGVGTPIRLYVIVGIVLAVVTSALTLWLAFHPMAPLTVDLPTITPTMRVVHALATPMTAIGGALLALAWVERNPGLVAFSAVYLVTVMVQGNQVIHSASPWSFLPFLLVPAAVLLAGSAGFALFRPSADSSAR